MLNLSFPAFVWLRFIHSKPDDVCYYIIMLFTQDNNTGIRQVFYTGITSSFDFYNEF